MFALTANGTWLAYLIATLGIAKQPRLGDEQLQEAATKASRAWWLSK